MVDEKTEENKPDLSKVLGIFEAGIEKDLEDDDIKMKMIGAKSAANFKNVTRIFNQFMIDTGRTISREAKLKIVEKHTDGTDLASEEGFDEAVSAIAKEATGVNELSAASLIRSWAKKAEVNVFAKAKSDGTRNPFINNFHAALIANPNLEEAGLQKVIDDLEDPQHRINPQRWFNQQNAIRKMVNTVAQSLNA